jgi:hypothetical protein
MIAALFVDPKGVYSGLPDVEVWDEARDARLYPGPWPVVAHPPCARWGKYWHGGPSSARSPRARKIKGDDGGCFASALVSVRRWGGVLEHPADSAAWAAHGLFPAQFAGGWTVADWDGGWTCRVEQGHFGHRARKATWLYVCRVRFLPVFPWGKSSATARLDDGFRSAEERKKRPCRYNRERLSKRERAATPIAFRDVLIEIAKSVQLEEALG